MRIIQEDTWFQGLVRCALLIPNPPTKFATTATTPTVKGIGVAQCSGGIVSITNFLGGADGTTLRLLGDGTTTIVNGATIITNTGANKLLTLNKVYRFTYFNSTKLWIEDA